MFDAVQGVTPLHGFELGVANDERVAVVRFGFGEFDFDSVFENGANHVRLSSLAQKRSHHTVSVATRHVQSITRARVATSLILTSRRFELVQKRDEIVHFVNHPVIHNSFLKLELWSTYSIIK
jgi:hypothetical protein